MYKKSEKCSDYAPSFIADQRGRFPYSDKRARKKLAKIAYLINAFCMLFVAGNTPVWAHGGGGGFHGGGFQEHEGFEGGGYSRESADSYHRSYSGWGFSGGYRGGEHYHSSLEGSSYGKMYRPFQEQRPTIHPFNQASTEIGHFNSFQHGGFTNKEFAGNANWVNHSYWHGHYWSGSYWHGGYWHNGYGHYWVGGTYWGGYWGPGPYWGWGNGFFYGALFGATITTALFLPTVYPEYYYAPLYYYPGPYNYTVLINDYPVIPTPPLRPAPQKVETWVPVKNGHIPVNAVLNNIVNKKETYYCRVKFNGKLSYGVLIPSDGCYVEKPSVTMRFSKYDILVSSIIG